MTISLGVSQIMEFTRLKQHIICWAQGSNIGAIREVWSVIWNLATFSKVRHFLWRLCTETLPIRCFLRNRHLIEDVTCGAN